MLTKTQATSIVNQYLVSTFRDRLSQAIEDNAARGIVGVNAFPYPSTATAGQVTTMTNQLQAAGWTVTVDSVGFTVTLS